MATKSSKIVVLTLCDDEDVFNVKTYTLVYEAAAGTQAFYDPEKAYRDAITEYLNTDAGKSEYERNCDHYNWGDAANIPMHFLEEQGFVDLGSGATQIVDLRYNEEFEPDED